MSNTWLVPEPGQAVTYYESGYDPRPAFVASVTECTGARDLPYALCTLAVLEKDGEWSKRQDVPFFPDGYGGKQATDWPTPCCVGKV